MITPPPAFKDIDELLYCVSDLAWLRDPDLSKDVGMVQLVYFPPKEMNESLVEQHSQQVTIYDSDYDYTFTSPSVYAVWETVKAWNSCDGKRSQLGPMLTSVIRAFDLTDISSMVPYHDSLTTMFPWEDFIISSGFDKRMDTKTPVQLTLSDLYYDCPSTVRNLFTSRGPNNMWTCPSCSPQDYRCNPYLKIPEFINEFGSPWWQFCHTLGTRLGMPDPPHALTYVSELVPLTRLNPADLSTSTTPGPLPSPAPVTAVQTQSLAQIPTPKSTVGPRISSTKASSLPENNPPIKTNPASAVSVAIIGTDVISAIPVPPSNANGASNVPPAIILPGGSTLKEGSTNIIPANDGSGKSIAVSVLSPGDHNGNTNGNGYLVLSTIGASLASTYNLAAAFTNANPTSTSVMRDFALPGTATGEVVYIDRTLTFGGAVATITSLNAVLSYGSKGIIVQYPGGIVSTVPIAAPSTIASSGTSASQTGASIASMIWQVMNGGATTETAPTQTNFVVSITVSSLSVMGQITLGMTTGGTGLGSGNAGAVMTESETATGSARSSSAVGGASASSAAVRVNVGGWLYIKPDLVEGK
ncbi:hypothetical protein G7Y89_g4239 [Cudoniella acicularis]|uniref:Uncharacterized protein n=1 Tax=Cudoniella acicularis TaxID=354080 RepID=A0A8H4W4W2_9HELO|nr:hypothetical protein G7Y89_g4239 [Cudoniella acicularis]